MHTCPEYPERIARSCLQLRKPQMFSPKHDLFRALAQARRAGRSGDIRTAERWVKVAERHVALARRIQDMAIIDHIMDIREAQRLARLAQPKAQQWQTPPVPRPNAFYD